VVSKLHLHVLASGSKGNAAVVEGPRGSILIDCGISRRELFRRAGDASVDLGRIRALLVTHEHIDHVRGISVFSKRYDGQLVSTTGTVGARADLMGLGFTLVDDDDVFDIAGIHVRTFPTSHDVADPMGFRFSTVDSAGSETDAIGWCTDTGFLTSEALGALRGCRILGIEANHDTTMLRNGDYPAFLKARIGGDRGHLSNEQTAHALRVLVTDETETVVALHLSENNNRPSVCVRTLAEATGAERVSITEARTPDGHLTVCCASQGVPLSVW
jgi:phosphoribosyl 1,2-cyclic phosphodiesterase